MAYADGATLLVEPHTAGPKRIPSPLTASDATFLRAILPDQITNDVNFERYIVVEVTCCGIVADSSTAVPLSLQSEVTDQVVPI